MAGGKGGGGGGAGPQSPETSMGTLWISVAVGIAALLLWSFAHEYIVAFVFKIKLYQSLVMGYFTPKLQDVVRFIQTTPPATVTWEQLMKLSEQVGEVVRYPVMGVLIIFGAILYLSNTTLRFRKKYSMKSLREQEVDNWPQIRPVIKLDLVSQDINKGPWSMALSPIEFARKHKLLKYNDVAAAKPGPVLTAAIKRGDAKRIFTMQLGPMWSGIDGLKGPVLVLFAAFAARINRDRKGSEAMLRQVNLSSSERKLNFSGAKALLLKHYNTQAVQEVIHKHAYLYTVMASMLEKARHDGVLPTAEFLWLKPTDRRLWYVLNSVGRQTPYSEVSGPFAHWLAEKGLHRRSIVPMVDEAVNALHVAVQEVKLSPAELEALRK